MKKFCIILIALNITLLFLGGIFLACNNQPFIENGSGGGGAEVNMNDYFTKDDVMDLFAELKMSSWGIKISDLFYTKGNVGIGTENPTCTLEVNGRISAGDGFECEYRNSAGVESKKFLHTKIIEIGDWNMDAMYYKNVTHGLGSTFKKIRNITAIIRNDADTNYHSLLRFSSGANSFEGGISYIGNIDIVPSRLTGGVFDSTNFNATSYNRGWIYIVYED